MQCALFRKGSDKCTPMRRGRYRAGFRKPPGDARCASCEVLSRRAETTFRPPPHDLARPLASPAGLGRLLRSMGKLGKRRFVIASINFQSRRRRFPNLPGRPRAVRRDHRHMKLASMWRRARRKRAKRAPAVSLLRRGSAITYGKIPATGTSVNLYVPL